MNELKEIFNETRYELLKKSNVVAVGLGYKVTEGVKTKDLAIVCSVTKKLPHQQLAKEDLIPSVIGDRRTDVVETGTIRALVDRTRRWRPAPGGVSIGHELITAGTLGCLVKKGGKHYILSNNHVLANSNKANVGDQILQPGPYDGGNLTMDMIARLSEFVPINFIGGENGCKIGNAFISTINKTLKITGRKTRIVARQEEQLENRVDAAIAEPIRLEDVNANILEIGPLFGTAIIGLGAEIKKSGRTTGVTTGTIDQVNVTVQVQYGEGKIALFVDQFMAGEMCSGGDSGSAVISSLNSIDNYLVGLLFAGSDTTTVINPIKYVFEELKLDSSGEVV